MDVKKFSQIIQDKNFYNYEKMHYKYGSDFTNALEVINDFFYQKLSIYDFKQNPIVYIEKLPSININSLKNLLKTQNEKYSIKAAEEEIISTSAIENIDFNRNSVRNILKGYAPKDEEENRILGFKMGLEFIADLNNKITEENLFKLYSISIGNFLEEKNKLPLGSFYRNDEVFVMSSHIEHTGLNYKQIPIYMKNLMEFINNENVKDDLIKAAIIHFDLAYIHPYFDGNGRMARLIHLWFLIQKGYYSTLFIPFSSLIEKTRKSYYNAFTQIEKNQKYSGQIDVTPFIAYFIENIYNNIISKNRNEVSIKYQSALTKGLITDKEAKLWNFVLSHYGTEEFSTKMLEKDYKDVAYATVRNFVLKFHDLELLSATQYGNKTKYKINE